MSLVTWSPPIASEVVWRNAPCVKIAMSVVPAPMSTRHHAELALVVGQHRGAEASGDSNSSTWSPQRLTHLVMFWAALTAR